MFFCNGKILLFTEINNSKRGCHTFWTAPYLSVEMQNAITNDYEGDETSQREILTDNYANKQLIDAEDVSFESVSEHHTESEQQTATIDPGY